MPAPSPEDATALDASDVSAMGSLYRAAIGEVSTDAYTRVFTRFEAADRAGAGWNWAASLCTFNWLLFRQLWGAALAYVGALVAGALLLFGIGRLVFRFDADTELALLGAAVAAAFVVPGLWGDALFYTACRKRIERALAAHATLPEACAVLLRQASTRRRLWVIAGGNALLAALGAATYVALPSVTSPGGLLPQQAAASAPVPPASPVAPAVSVAGPITLAPEPASSAASSAGAGASAGVTASANVSAPATPKVDVAAAAAPPASAPASASSAASVPAAAPPMVVVRPPARAARPAASAKPATPAKPAAAGKPAAAVKPATAEYVVNVGLFADENNALNAYTKLIDAGLPATRSRVSGPKGKFQRVRVGPFETQAEANAAAEKVRSLGLEAIVAQP